MASSSRTARLALAQSASLPVDIETNVGRHVALARDAADAGASVVLFPELSLTGYELDRIADEPSATVRLGDARLEPLRRVAADDGITVVAGAPLWHRGQRLLAALAISAVGPVRTYAKRNLFGQEREVFEPGRGPLVLDVAGLRLALGVCADLADGRQVDEVAALDADAWLVGALITDAGYDADAERAARAARRTGATVCVVNHAAPTGGWLPAGRSAAWGPDGVVARLSSTDGAPREGLLVVEISGRLS